MSKIVAAVVTTLFLTASPLAYAQVPAAGVVERLSAGDVSALTDARINLVKAERVNDFETPFVMRLASKRV